MVSVFVGFTVGEVYHPINILPPFLGVCQFDFFLKSSLPFVFSVACIDDGDDGGIYFHCHYPNSSLYRMVLAKGTMHCGNYFHIFIR